MEKNQHRLYIVCTIKVIKKTFSSCSLQRMCLNLGFKSDHFSLVFKFYVLYYQWDLCEDEHKSYWGTQEKRKNVEWTDGGRWLKRKVRHKTQ